MTPAELAEIRERHKLVKAAGPFAARGNSPQEAMLTLALTDVPALLDRVEELEAALREIATLGTGRHPDSASARASRALGGEG
jgi:hypothetical protein